jgi:hypothetical protein
VSDPRALETRMDGVTHKPSPFTTFYYPPKMFADAQTTLNILVTLEDAFMAAYLRRARQASSSGSSAAAARRRVTVAARSSLLVRA